MVDDSRSPLTRVHRARDFVIFYRIVPTDSPTVHDFNADEALGIPIIGDDPERIRLGSGISVYSTQNQARRKAQDLPHLGNYIAVLDVPDEGVLRVERTTRSRGHHTLWGDPEAILAWVVAVRPVSELA
jgi:hypothetical protein